MWDQCLPSVYPNVPGPSRLGHAYQFGKFTDNLYNTQMQNHFIGSQSEKRPSNVQMTVSQLLWNCTNALKRSPVFITCQRVRDRTSHRFDC